MSFASTSEVQSYSVQFPPDCRVLGFQHRNPGGFHICIPFDFQAKRKSVKFPLIFRTPSEYFTSTPEVWWISIYSPPGFRLNHIHPKDFHLSSVWPPWKLLKSRNTIGCPTDTRWTSFRIISVLECQQISNGNIFSVRKSKGNPADFHGNPLLSGW